MIVGVPWRAGDFNREISFRHVAAHLVAARCEFITADSGHGSFNRAASRNLAVAHARALGADVIILHDADMLCPPSAYREMADLAYTTGTMVVGYHDYRALTQAQTVAVIARGADPWVMEVNTRTDGWSLGGVIAITPDAWDAVGGMDERFQGWGCEDWAFAHAASIILGPHARLTTPAVHLWHPHEADPADPRHEANGALLARWTAATTPAQLRQVREMPWPTCASA